MRSIAIAGFQDPSSGDVLLEDRSLLSVPSHKRNIGMVFQRYTLFPHLASQSTGAESEVGMQIVRLAI